MLPVEKEVEIGEIVLSDSIMENNGVEVLKNDIANHSRVEYVFKCLSEACCGGSGIMAGLNLEYQEDWLSISSLVLSSLSVIFSEFSQDQSDKGDLKRAEKKNLKKNEV